METYISKKLKVLKKTSILRLHTMWMGFSSCKALPVLRTRPLVRFTMFRSVTSKRNVSGHGVGSSCSFAISGILFKLWATTSTQAAV